MKSNLKKLHEFHDLDDFCRYINKYMKNASLEVKDTSINEIEVLIKCNDSVIGVWKDYQNYGFIEEYRGVDRVD